MEGVFGLFFAGVATGEWTFRNIGVG